MITVEDAKAHCRIEHDAEDGLMASLISAAFRQIENRTGQAFEQVEGAEMVLDSLPLGGVGIELQWTPVRTVNELVFLDPQGVEQTMPAAELSLDARGVYPKLYPVTEWPQSKAQRASVKVKADIGYAELPADVRAAALLIIGHLYEHREAVVVGTIATDLPMGVELLLAPYVIHRVG